jgi:HTH-type transcriptional regulator / antitoxin HigA
MRRRLQCAVNPNPPFLRYSAASNTPIGDQLDVLAPLIDVCEAKHHAMNPPDLVDAIKFRMEQQGMTRKDLEDIIGTRTRLALQCQKCRTASAACPSV